MNVEPYQFSELDDFRIRPLGGSHNNQGTDIWTGFFQGETGNLFLLLEQAKGRQQRMCPLALICFLGEYKKLPHVNGLEARTSRNSWQSMHSNPFWGGSWRWVFACSSCAKPRGIAMRHTQLVFPFNNCFFVCYSPVGLINVSPNVYQGQLIYGSIPLMAAIKVKTLDVWTSSFQDKAGSLVLLLEWYRWIDWQKCQLTFFGSQDDCRQYLDAC